MYPQDQETHSEGQHEVLPMIQTLPADVLREIFRRCLPPFKYQASADFELDKPPYTLAEVCRHWRSICLSTPLLWVDLPSLFTDEAPFSPEFSRHWRTKLALSSPCDLRFYLYHYDNVPDDALTEILEQIQPTLPRVRVLDIRTNTQMLSAISQRADLFKRLKVLKISMIDDYTTNPFPQLDFPTPVTSLIFQSRKSVEVSRRLLKCVEALWPSLTKFDGDYLPASSFREILATAPLMVELTIRNAQPAANPPASPVSPFIHTRLKILHLCKSKSMRNPDVLDLSGIRLPELEDFVAEIPMPSAFLSFLEHTQGSLRNLHIGGVFNSPYDQKAMYDLCPRLEALTIAHADDESLKHLTPIGSSGNKPMCPRLRCLTLPSFRLKSEDQTFWLSELTNWRFSRLNDPNFPNDCVPMESLTIVVTKASNFLQFRSLRDFAIAISHLLSMDPRPIYLQKKILSQFEEYIQTNPYHSIYFLDDLGIIASLKEFGERKAESPNIQVLQEAARKISSDLMALLRAKPRWKMEKDPHMKKRLEKFVFRNHLVSQRL